MHRILGLILYLSIFLERQPADYGMIVALFSRFNKNYQYISLGTQGQFRHIIIRGEISGTDEW